MAEQVLWLQDVRTGIWSELAKARQAGCPVPDGFLASNDAPELEIRHAYEDLKVREHTHYVAVRHANGAELDVIGSDRLTHTIHRLRTQMPDSEIFIQAMVNGAWCGKATREGRNFRIHASEGLLCLDPDMYLFQSGTGKCTRRVLHQQPRKVFRGVDGTTRTMEIRSPRQPLEIKFLAAIDTLAAKAAANITWTLDDRKIWLLGVRRP